MAREEEENQKKNKKRRGATEDRKVEKTADLPPLP